MQNLFFAARLQVLDDTYKYTGKPQKGQTQSQMNAALQERKSRVQAALEARMHELEKYDNLTLVLRYASPIEAPNPQVSLNYIDPPTPTDFVSFKIEEKSKRPSNSNADSESRGTIYIPSPFLDEKITRKRGFWKLRPEESIEHFVDRVIETARKLGDWFR